MIFTRDTLLAAFPHPRFLRPYMRLFLMYERSPTRCKSATQNRGGFFLTDCICYGVVISLEIQRHNPLWNHNTTTDTDREELGRNAMCTLLAAARLMVKQA